MKFSIVAPIVLSAAWTAGKNTVEGFSPAVNKHSIAPSSTSIGASFVSDNDNANMKNNKPIYDPLGLYPEDSPERKQGLIQPLESSIVEEQDRTVIDPLSIYPAAEQRKLESEKENIAMSPSLPFLKRPDMLDGSLPGDRGFDPFNFSSNPKALDWYRSAELKHARLAMLAAVGWPVAEILHKTLANSIGLDSILSSHDRVPSVLNGGLSQVNPAFWVAAIGAAAVLETLSSLDPKVLDPAVLETDAKQGEVSSSTQSSKLFFQQESELFHGRLGMLAITIFALQEWWTQLSVVHPFFSA